MSLGQILNYVPNMYAYRKRYQFGGGEILLELSCTLHTGFTEAEQFAAKPIHTYNNGWSASWDRKSDRDCSVFALTID